MAKGRCHGNPPFLVPPGVADRLSNSDDITMRLHALTNERRDEKLMSV